MAIYDVDTLLCQITVTTSGSVTNVRAIEHTEEVSPDDVRVLIKVSTRAVFEDVPPVSIPAAGVADPLTPGGWLVPPATGHTPPAGTGGVITAAEPTETSVVPFLINRAVMPDIYACNVFNGRPDPSLFVPTITTEIAGWLRVVIDGRDVTFYRDCPVEVESVERELPFGSLSAVLRFPQVTRLEAWGAGDLKWLRPQANVDIDLVDHEGNIVSQIFEGFTISVDPMDGSGMGAVVECQGALMQADLVLKKPDFAPMVEDLGKKIPRLLNEVPNRRYKRMNKVDTGIEFDDRGQWEPLLTGYIGELLARSFHDEDPDDQWTITMGRDRKPRLQRKSLIGQRWTTTVGTPGVEISLKRDALSEPTAIYGAGADMDANGYANLRVPATAPGGFVSMGWSGGSLVIGVGDTDEDFWGWITMIQKRLQRLGYDVDDPTGVFRQQDKDAIKAVQLHAGEEITGEVDANTWYALFDVGYDAGRISSSRFLPFAFRRDVEPNLYYADGSFKGKNPANTGQFMVIERFRRFADGTSKRFAYKVARNELNRDKRDEWAGDIVFQVDPEEDRPGGRFAIREGDSIELHGWAGAARGDGGLIVYVSHVTVDGEGVVTCTVSTGNRDGMALDALRERERESKTFSRRKGWQPKVQSRPPADSELIGWIHPHDVPAGKWVVYKIPIGWNSQINWLDIRSTDSPSEFVMAFFDRKVTSKMLTQMIGNPLAERPDGYAPFPGDEATADWLDEHFWLECLGGPGMPAGYWPGRADRDHPITGRHRDTVNFTAGNASPPFMWIAEYSPVDTTIEGKIRIAPQAW